MKNRINIIAIIATILAFTACSDSDSFNPYEAQKKVSFYPQTLSYINNNRSSDTTEDWTFTYNNDNTIKSYSSKQTIVKGQLIITQTEKGELSYSKDLNGNMRIKNDVTKDYSNNVGDMENNRKETISETVTFKGDNIVKIELDKSVQNGSNNEQTYGEWSFEYNNDYCTRATYKEDNKESITYLFHWNGYLLTQVSINSQNKNKDLQNEIHEYSYSNILAKDYEFDPMAFVLGNFPKIYAAMGFFGKTTPYLLESEKYELSIRNLEINNGEPYQEDDLMRDYSIADNNTFVTVEVQSDNDSYSVYRFNE